MALPIWANFMKGCYTIDALGISKDEFSIPEELSIITECKQYNEEGEAFKVNEVINPEIDF